MNPFRAIALKLSSIAVFVCMASLIKYASTTVPPGQAVFFRSAFALPVIVAWLFYLGDFPGGLKTRRPFAHLWRGAIGTTGMALGFAALAYLPLPDVTAIGYLAPVLVVILAALFLGERLRVFRITAVILGLAGVFVVVAPKLTLLQASASDTTTLGVVLVLGSACAAAIAQVTVRSMVANEKTAAIVFYFTLFATFASSWSALWGWVWPGKEVVAALIAAGFLGGVGQIFLTAAYRYADVSVIAPFEYASILLAIASGYYFFDEVPSGQTLFGASLVILAGILIIWRERQLGLQRGKARPAMTPGDK